MATLTKDEILDAVAGMTVLELSELVKDLQFFFFEDLFFHFSVTNIWKKSF